MALIPSYDFDALHRNNIILGCASLGGLYHKPVKPEDAALLIEIAVKKYGIRNIDTAPWYGCGQSELDVGLAFRTRAHRVAQFRNVSVITKAGRHLRRATDCSADDPSVAWGDTCYHINNPELVCMHDYTYDGIMKSYEQSVSRLHPAPIFNLRLHDCDTSERFGQALNEGGIDALVELKTKGLVSQISLGTNAPEYILKLLSAVPTGTFDNVMMAGAWNLVDQSGFGVLQHCQQQPINSRTTIHIAGVFGAGLLWGGSNCKYSSASTAVINKRAEWEELAARHGVELPSLALAFAAAPQVVSHVAFGCASVKELHGCMAAAAKVPSLATFEKIMSDAAAKGLIDARMVPAFRHKL